MDIWASWPDCPRHYLGDRYIVGGEAVQLSEAIRWAALRGLRRKTSARVSHLARVWSRLDGAQARLETHIAAQRKS
ncbi:hypothetical protein [Zavarzinia sp.]|uniref:hypothetical protein n=1 Tax=Zavarzinia sp. TaxID=2027920 RepID=UPI0035662FB7